MAVGTKLINWRDRILRDGERRYIRDVLKPAAADLRAARARMKAAMPKGRNADPAKVALYQTQLKAMDVFGTRLQRHMDSTLGRFSARKKGTRKRK